MPRDRIMSRTASFIVTWYSSCVGIVTRPAAVERTSIAIRTAAQPASSGRADRRSCTSRTPPTTNTAPRIARSTD